MIPTSNLICGTGNPPDGLLVRFVLGEPRPGVEHLKESLATLRDLAALPGILDQAIGVLLPAPRRDYKAFWDQARAVAALFRTTYFARDDRARLWREYSDLCHQVKGLGLAEKDERAAKSTINSEGVRSLVLEAKHWACGGMTGTDLAQARALLGQAMDLLKRDAFLHQERQECFVAWREAADAINSARQAMHRAAFDALTQELRGAAGEVSSGDTFRASGLLRMLKGEIQTAELSPDQRRLLYNEVRALWGKLIPRIEAKKVERSRMREAHARRLDGWRDRKAARLENLAEWRDQNHRKIEQLQGEAAELEGQIATAWNDSWADRARGWVQAKYAKICDLEARNEELERQIAEIRSRLGGR